jgi:hypothetical protein
MENNGKGFNMQDILNKVKAAGSRITPKKIGVELSAVLITLSLGVMVAGSFSAFGFFVIALWGTPWASTGVLTGLMFVVGYYLTVRNTVKYAYEEDEEED